MENRNFLHQTPLCCAVEYNSLEYVKALVSRGADTTILLPGDVTLLHLAVRNNCPEILQYLLQTSGGDRRNVRSKQEGGSTPLEIAAKHGYIKCVNKLLQSGVEISLGTNGNMALHLAAKSGHLEVVKALIDYDRTLLDMKNKEGWYPLHIAAGQGHADCVRHMILNGADISAMIKNDTGKKTAIEIILYCVPKPVEFFQTLFNYYVSPNRFAIYDLECEIELKYDVLMPNGEYEKQLKVIDAIVNSGNNALKENLLLHPISESFLYLKWMKLRTYFIAFILLYVILTIAVTTSSHIRFIEKNNVPVYTIVSLTARIIMFLCLIPITSIEIIHACQLTSNYFLDSESWVKWSVIIGACALDTLGSNMSWIHYLASITVLLAWIELLLLISRWPSCGFYVLMFSRVASKVLKVLVTFAFLMIGFAFSFQILFEAKVPFGSILESIVKVIIMMNEFDYEDMFDQTDRSTAFFVVGKSIFLVFALLVAVVMMNLIVGLSVNDIARLEAHGRTQQLVKQASFLSFMELFLYSKKLNRLPQKWKTILSRRRSVINTILIKPTRFSESHVRLPQTIIDNIINIVNKVENDKIYINKSSYNLSKNSSEKKETIYFEKSLTNIMLEQRLIKDAIENMKYKIDEVLNRTKDTKKVKL